MFCCVCDERGRCVADFREDEPQMDLRVKKTRIAIRKAFWELTMERGFGNVTVSEVCRRAMINRTTFYRHYEDLDDLATRGTQEYLDELWRQAEPPPKEPATYDTSTPPHNMVLLFSFVSDNAAFLRFALGERGIPYFVTQLRRYLEQVTIQRIPAVLNARTRPLLPPSLIAKTLAGELIGTVIWWLERDCTPGVETMAHYAMALVALNIYEVLGIEGPRMDAQVLEKLRRETERLE
jgi:AcrR family transcriptional regulator